MNAVYQLALAFLFGHELDAMTHSEWRLLFGLRALEEARAEHWFVVLHVPLFWAILRLSYHESARVRLVTQTVVSSFLLVHGLLHVRLTPKPEYAFHDALSRTLIFGAAACGALWLVLAVWRRRIRVAREGVKS